MNNGSSNTNAGTDPQYQTPYNDNITPAALLEQLVYVDTFMPEIDDPTQLDERLTAELSAFADDSFIFPDEEKPKKPEENDNNEGHNNNNGVTNGDLNLNGQSLLFNNLNNGTNSSNLGISNHTAGLPINSFGNGINSMLPLNSLSNHSSPSANIYPSSINTGSNNSRTNGKPTDLLSTLPKVHVPPGAQSSLIAAGLSQTQIDALAALIAQHQGGSAESTSPLPQNSLGSTSRLNSIDQTFQAHSPLNSISVNPLTTSLSTESSAQTPASSSSIAQSLRNNENAQLPPELADIKVEPTGDVELDKRRRNTAASARFRIKKKLKEQQLERSVRELTELSMTLEKKIQTLEMENRLLRNLVVEKGEQRNNNELELLKQRARMANDNEFNSGAGPSSGFNPKGN